MARPDVELKEIDLSLLIRGESNTKAAMVAEMNKGPLEPQLITNNKQFKEVYGQPSPALLGYYSAFAYLSDGDGLYVKRVVGAGALYGGIVWTDTTNPPDVIGAGVSDPSAYSFDTFELFLITPLGPGSYDNGKVAVYLDNVDTIDSNYVYDVVVLVKNSEGVFEEKERHYVTKDPTMKDGFGRSMYIEDVINSQSKYIEVLDNTALDATVEPSVLVSGQYVEMGEGVDGAAATAGEISTGWDAIKSKALYPYYMLINAGYTDATVQAKMISIAENNRQIAILDTTYGTTPSDAVTFRTLQNIDSSYGAFYYNWLKVYDVDNDKYVWVPPSGAVAGIFARSFNIGNMGTSPAGTRRGKINCIEIERPLEDAEQDILYNAQINFLTYRKGAIYLFGSKTAQIKETQLSYLNTRNSLNFIEDAIEPALDDFLFEINDDFTRLQAYTAVDDFMNTVRAQRMVEDKEVVCDESNNPPEVVDLREMHLDVYVKPTKDVQWIQVQVVITKSTVNFEELIATGGNF